MLRSNSKSLGNHVVSPKEEKERLLWEGFADFTLLRLLKCSINRFSPKLSATGAVDKTSK